jgi:WD40 repeat protein
MRPNRFACIAVLSVASAFGIHHLHANNADTAAPARAQRISGLGAADFSGHENGVSIQDVAIAPDSSAFVVKFAVGEDAGKAGLFLGLWSVPDSKLLLKIRLAAYKGVPNAGRTVHTLEFSPDGAIIVATDGSTVYIIDAATLKLLHSIDLPPNAQASKYSPFVRAFSISRDSTTLAVLSGDGPYAPGVDLVRVFRLKTGNEIARWNPAEKLKSISISSSGELLLTGRWDPRQPEDILLVETLTGKTLRRFRSGFAFGQGYSNLSAAVFLEDHKLLAVPDHYVDSKGKYADRLELVDSTTGATLQDLSYERFGPTGIVAVSGDEKIIVALNYPRKHAKGAQLLFYRPDEKAPVCILDPVPVQESNGKSTGNVRFGSDPMLFAIFTPQNLGIYRVSNCNLTPAESLNSD